jgi:hypothetical protein
MTSRTAYVTYAAGAVRRRAQVSDPKLSFNV